MCQHTSEASEAGVPRESCGASEAGGSSTPSEAWAGTLAAFSAHSLKFRLLGEKTFRNLGRQLKWHLKTL